MDWLEFVQKSEWPAVVAGGLWLFRKPFTQVLAGLRPRKVKGFGIDAEFDPEPALQKAEELTKKLPAPETEPLPRPEALKSKPEKPPGIALDEALPELPPVPRAPDETGSAEELVNLDESSGLVEEAMVIRAFRYLEEAIRTAFAVRTGRDASSRIILINAARVIGFNEDEVTALRELQLVRNRVVHRNDVELTMDEAARFVDVAKRLQGRVLVLAAMYGLPRYARMRPRPTSDAQSDSA